jgi:hypothetical protein
MLLDQIIHVLKVKEVDVNDQNDQAVRFYCQNGFIVSSRSDKSGIGNLFYITWEKVRFL